MFRYVSGVFSDETEGIRSRSLALKKSCNMPQLSVAFNTASITKHRLFIPNKKSICCSLGKRKRIVCWHKKVTKSPTPPSNLYSFHRNEGLSPLIPNATLGALALRCCGGPGCTPSPWCGAGCSHCCSGRWAGHWSLRCQHRGCALAVELLTIAAGGKWFGSAPASQRLGNHLHSWRGEHCKVSMSLA